MQAHSWRRARLLKAGLVVAIVGLFSVLAAGTASAAPARNLQVYNQQCVGGGAVQVSISWTPSNQGTQWFDVSRSSSFSGFQNQGPLASSAYYIGWILESNTTYYARVATFTPQLEYSNTLQFTTINCGTTFTPPSGANATVFDDFVRINWNRGNNNLFYCVDTAFTQSDLLNIHGSWHNWGCGTTGTSLDLTNLACDRQHFARVWAAGPGTSGYSNIVSFVSQDCDVNFTAPTNPRDQVLSSTSARLAWDRGVNNFFFCVDLARSQSDLVNLSGTWFNTACGTTGTAIDVTGLQCGTTYWWRTWAAGPGTSGYTSIESFTTQACAFVPPTDLNVESADGDEVTFSWEEQSDAAWFCVDYAGSQSHLVNFGSSWRNHCVGGNVEMTTVENPDYWDCDETYYWRVFAFSNAGSGYSDIESFTINC